MIDVKKNLKLILEERGILQKQLAVALGLSDQAISNWFNGTEDVKLGKITQICEAAGVSLIDVLTYPEKYVPEKQAKPECEKCKEKDEIIANLNELLAVYKAKLKAKK